MSWMKERALEGISNKKTKLKGHNRDGERNTGGGEYCSRKLVPIPSVSRGREEFPANLFEHSTGLRARSREGQQIPTERRGMQ